MVKFKKNVIKPGMIIHCQKEKDAKKLLEHLKEIGYDENHIPAYPHNFYKIYDDGLVSWFSELNDKIKNAKITEFSDLLEPDPTEPKFKVGDKARIRRDLESGKGYGRIYATVQMAECAGKEATISGICSNKREYLLKEFDRTWAEEMLEPVENSTEMSTGEVLDWLAEANDEILYTVFACESVSEVLNDFSAEQIIKSITDYEAAKEKPKPVEVESGWYYEIFTCESNRKGKIIYKKEIWDDGFDEIRANNEAAEMAKRYAVENNEKVFFHTWGICRVKEDEA